MFAADLLKTLLEGGRTVTALVLASLYLPLGLVLYVYRRDMERHQQEWRAQAETGAETIRRTTEVLTEAVTILREVHALLKEERDARRPGWHDGRFRSAP